MLRSRYELSGEFIYRFGDKGIDNAEWGLFLQGVAPLEDMQDYWNTQYFHRVPPPYVLASEEAVLEFLANPPGAIGYVNIRIPKGQVKVLIRLPFSSSP